jgi:hypothetical protein
MPVERARVAQRFLEISKSKQKLMANSAAKFPHFYQKFFNRFIFKEFFNLQKVLKCRRHSRRIKREKSGPMLKGKLQVARCAGGGGGHSWLKMM